MSLNIDQIDVPDSIRIKEYECDSLERSWVLIQDAHCNYQAQLAIADAVRWLVRDHGLRLVAVEGSVGLIDTSPFASFSDKEIKKDVADYFMKQGKITGPEFESICGEGKFEIHGVDDSELWQENNKALMNALNAKEKTLSYCSKARSLLEGLKESALSSLRDSKGFWEFHQFAGDMDKMGIVQFAEKMRKIVADLGINVFRHPVFPKILDRNISGYGEMESTAETFFDACEEISGEVYDAYLKGAGDKAQEFFSLLRALYLLEVMVSVELRPMLWDEVEGEDPEARRGKKAKRLDLGLHDRLVELIRAQGGDPSSLDKEEVEDGLNAGRRFYELASRRSRVLAEKTNRLKDEKGLDNVALVTGGFHTFRCARKFEADGVPYIILTPRIRKADPESREKYIKIMQGEKTPFEKFLEDLGDKS